MTDLVRCDLGRLEVDRSYDQVRPRASQWVYSDNEKRGLRIGNDA